jgi:hypothetical protein
VGFLQVCIQIGLASPVFIETEEGGVFSVLMQHIVDAAFFRSGGGDEGQGFLFHFFDLVGFGYNLGDHGNRGIRHNNSPLVMMGLVYKNPAWTEDDGFAGKRERNLVFCGYV